MEEYMAKLKSPPQLGFYIANNGFYLGYTEKKNKINFGKCLELGYVKSKKEIKFLEIVVDKDGFKELKGALNLKNKSFSYPSVVIEELEL
jgi:hypothetical protein